MYSKQEASRLRQEFWTVFGQYMSPVPSAEGEKVNWINYKTGEKDLFFRMDAVGNDASTEILLAHKDDGIQSIYFEQFMQLRKILEEHTGEEWQWEAGVTDTNGRTVSRIIRRQSGLNIYRKEDWPALISFFKPRILALDAFWSSAKYGFESLR